MELAQAVHATNNNENFCQQYPFHSVYEYIGALSHHLLLRHGTVRVMPVVRDHLTQDYYLKEVNYVLNQLHQHAHKRVAVKHVPQLGTVLTGKALYSFNLPELPFNTNSPKFGLDFQTQFHERVIVPFYSRTHHCVIGIVIIDFEEPVSIKLARRIVTGVNRALEFIQSHVREKK